jgi:hypothetical protein
MDNQDTLTDKPLKIKDTQNTQQQSQLVTQQMILPGTIKQRHLVGNPTQVGDMYYGLDGNSFANLPIGSEAAVLSVASGVPVWQAYRFPTGLAASRPSSGTVAGQMFFATDTFVLSVWSGAAWKTTTLS